MIAAKMKESLESAAQLSFHAECDASGLLACRAALKQAGRAGGIEDLLILALARSLAAHPGLNGHVVENRIELYEALHIAIAVALPNGLVAPAIFDVQTLDLDGIAAARADLVERARAGRLQVTEMTGGTITLSNLGLSRVYHFTPILSVPQIAILGIGCMRPSVVPRENGEIGIAQMMGLSLTIDHRAIDGAPAAAFLTRLCEEIEGIERQVFP